MGRPNAANSTVLGRGNRPASKHEPDRSLVRTGLYKMRAAEGREEVVQRHFVGQVGNSEPQRRTDALLPEEVVGSKPQIEYMPGRDAGRIVIVVCRALLRNDQPGGAVVRGGT